MHELAVAKFLLSLTIGRLGVVYPVTVTIQGQRYIIASEGDIGIQLVGLLAYV